jgi:hypothetical protein
VVQNRRLRKGGTLTAEDHKIEVVRRIKYVGTVINDSIDETEEIRARILAANKAYSSLQTIFRSKQIHRNNKIRLYKTLIKPILCYGSVIWTLIQTAEQMLDTFEREILRRIYMAQHKKGDAGVPDGTANCTVYTVSHTSWRTLTFWRRNYFFNFSTPCI